ncbi:MAG: aminotransferase class I/II-fold pyridoxal phosphate-dependent enzyme [Rhodospirillales bacterium]|nr:aminotransferase class I/II-fold pyridoxal phosphate-dependent enzyme [Rhodospirillales bacterium]
MTHDPGNEPKNRPETLAARALGWIDPGTGAVSPPIQPSTTYARGPDYKLLSPHIYVRGESAAYDQPEALLTRLEKGAASALFASGMAATAAVFQALLPGDHVVVQQDIYFLMPKWLREWAVPWGLEVSFVATGDLAAIAKAIKPGKTKIVWIETPANPTWTTTDIAAAAAIAHKGGARLVVDNTSASPVLTRPLELGADLVMHSATKYLNGHSDVLAGALVTAKDDDHWKRIKMVRTTIGGVLGTFESWLLLRGMRTLHLRVRQQSLSAMAIARHFEKHPKVAGVNYPGLESDPGHAVAKKQMEGGFGGMLSLRLKGGAPACLAFVARLELFVRATSLGGVESLIEHRGTIEGQDSPTPQDLLRVSVGIEHVDDLIADLEQGFAAV